jgi:hypothetical protein
LAAREKTFIELPHDRQQSLVFESRQSELRARPSEKLRTLVREAVEALAQTRFFVGRIGRHHENSVRSPNRCI